MFLEIQIALSLTAVSALIKASPILSKYTDTSSCPFFLPAGGYEFPHLIVPINNSDIAIGNSYVAEVSPDDYATVFNFGIPPSRANQQCSLYFTFPRHDQLATSDYSWVGNNTGTEGPGTLQAVEYKYGTGATDNTTGKTLPPLGTTPIITVPDVSPGNAYKIWSGSSGPGGVMSWELSSPDSCLRYFQDWNECAIGLWIVYDEPVPTSGPSCGKCPDSTTMN